MHLLTRTFSPDDLALHNVVDELGRVLVWHVVFVVEAGLLVGVQLPAAGREEGRPTERKNEHAVSSGHSTGG